MTTQAQKLLPDLEKYAKSLPQDFSEISDERKENLTQIANFIFEKYTKNEPSKLVFICTHNSRRSQFAQVWAKIAANYYGFDSEKIHNHKLGVMRNEGLIEGMILGRLNCDLSDQAVRVDGTDLS